MTTPTPITPTVGRKVWYYMDALQAQPWDATVIKVHAPADEATPDTPVNLLVINPDSGGSIFRPFIGHRADEEGFTGERFAWMPYQTKVAATQAVLDTPVPFGQSSGGIAPAGNALEPTLAVETKTYTDGSSTTGPGPLPDQSPAQQDAAQAQSTGEPAAS